ncbi:Glycerol kinase [Actinomortierella ambigua]|uniref:glycerol kinase n=1 Tax=Actinomortierella ambigua TaxID=1343610 RepID=A0A9P6PXD4_9FUNG|nr:Glycerol kinase [Actinomortierella ambigua]KAG0255028.1 Glycerol kinase [Actinomortierella ambigua]
MPSFIGAIDNGTTSSRFLIFDENGELVIGDQLEYRQYYPHPGWVEQDAMDILDSVVSCIKGALRKFELQGYHISDLKGIGITNQRETTIVWDRETGRPLHHAIVWSDVRTKGVVKQLSEKTDKGADILKDVCGLPITTYFSAVKLRWLLDNVPAVKQAHENGTLMFGTVDSWLIYNLTGSIDGGVHVTDVTNASRTMLMDLRKLNWCEQALEFFGVRREILPEIKPSSTLFGKVKIHAIPDLRGLPITGCLGDQHAALVGQQCFEVGEAKNTYGTGCFMVFNTGTEVIPSNNGLLTTVGYQFEGEPAAYALEGSVAVAGSAVKWLRDNMNIIRSAEEINDLAEKVEDSAGVVFVTAFSGLFAPYWRPEVRGCILGLTQHTTKHHLARATLEATCFQTRAILEAMNADSGKDLKNLRVDGGLSNSDICMQMQADILGIEVARPQMRESTALGAATAAAIYLDVGMWKGGFKAFSQRCKDHKDALQIFSPNISANERNTRYELWQRAVESSFTFIE